MDQDTLKNCGFVKTILMLLVILGHACAFWSGHWFTENPAIQSIGLDILYSWVNSFHIYAFAVVSGYLFAFKVLKGEYSEYSKFLINKAKRLLVPYLFVMFIWVAPISAYFFNWNLSYLFKKYILCIEPSQLWFLWMLFDIFAFVWIFKRVMLKRPIIGWVISLFLYGVGIVGNKVFPNVFCIWTACQYVPFFFIGIRIRSKEEKNDKLITETVPWFVWGVADVAVFVIGNALISRQSDIVWSLIGIGMTFVLHIVGAGMAFTTLQALARRIHWKNSKVFKKLSSYSMPIYLFHQQIIYFCIFVLNGKINPWINAGINFVVALIGSFAISAILMRWKTTRFLIGEK